MGNANKSAILGENFSTASGRLKKQTMFWLLQRLGEDCCFRCGELIESDAQLSVEHKVPWRTKEQFWDLDNVSFSHLDCNSAASKPVASHGTTNMYGRHACRCVACTAAKRTENAKRKR